VCIDRIRTERRRDRANQQLAVLTQPGHHSGDSASRVALFELIQRLDPDRREALVLTQLLGFSYEETAAICDRPIGTIRSRVARARADLIADGAAIEENQTPRQSNAAD